jgi:mannosyl-3-phosphoglycerate phosphatase
MRDGRCVILSGLDGAFLDERTYNYGPAVKPLTRLKQDGIPLMFVSGRTRREIERLQRELGICDGFSAENGALIVTEAEDEVVLGRPGRDLLKALGAIASAAGAEVEPLSLMSPRRVTEMTGLRGDAAERAQKREYSQPFLLRHGCLGAIRMAAEELRLHVLPGRRFHTLVGRHDKGSAVKRLRRDYPHAWAVGIGGAPDDVAFLQAVDVPVFLGGDPPTGLPRDTLHEHHPGPIGWARTVKWVLDDLLESTGHRLSMLA